MFLLSLHFCIYHCNRSSPHHAYLSEVVSRDLLFVMLPLVAVDGWVYMHCTPGSKCLFKLSVVFSSWRTAAASKWQQCAVTQHYIQIATMYAYLVEKHGLAKLPSNLGKLSVSLHSLPEATTQHYIDMLVHSGFGLLLGWKLHIPYSFSYEKVTPGSSDLTSLNSDHDASPRPQGKLIND